MNYNLRFVNGQYHMLVALYKHQSYVYHLNSVVLFPVPINLQNNPTWTLDKSACQYTSAYVVHAMPLFVGMFIPGKS